MKHPCIGILAGMGPRSTAPFIDRVVDECVLQYGAKYDTDFPAMLVYSLPTPFYPDRPVDREALSGAILAGLGELAGFGVDFIAMPCNIAHVYYDELKSSINVPLLNIIDETVSRIPVQSRGVALFAARGTAESGIYQRGIAASGKTLVCKPEWQDSIDALILAVKERGASEENKKAMAELLADAKQSGADCAVIGCTDLTPLISRSNEDIEVLDSAKCLAKAAIQRYLELNK
jgi:aspartate racemase